MKQTLSPEDEGKRVPCEVTSIFKTVEKYSSRYGFSADFGASKSERWLGRAALLFLSIAIPSIFVAQLQIVALGASFAFLLSSILLFLAQGQSIVSTFHAPLKGYADGAERRLRDRTRFVSELGSFSSVGLSMVKVAMENDTLRIQKRLGLLIGVVEKAGFIPAGLALYYAAVEATSGSDALPANLLMAFVFGLYVGAYLGHRLVEALSYSMSCVDEAFEIALKREQS